MKVKTIPGLVFLLLGAALGVAELMALFSPAAGDLASERIWALPWPLQIIVGLSCLFLGYHFIFQGGKGDDVQKLLDRLKQIDLVVGNQTTLGPVETAEVRAHVAEGIKEVSNGSQPTATEGSSTSDAETPRAG